MEVAVSRRCHDPFIKYVASVALTKFPETRSLTPLPAYEPWGEMVVKEPERANLATKTADAAFLVKSARAASGNVSISQPSVADSGYASGPPTRCSFAAEGSDRTLVGKHDRQTGYSAATPSVAPIKAQQSMELAHMIVNTLGLSVDAKELVKSRRAFPGLIKAFSINLGLESGSPIVLATMNFVHMYHG